MVDARVVVDGDLNTLRVLRLFLYFASAYEMY